MFATLLIFHATVSSVSTRIIARIQNLYIVANMLYVIWPFFNLGKMKFIRYFGSLILAIIILIPAATPKEFKNSAKFALGGFQNCALTQLSVFFSLSNCSIWVVGWIRICPKFSGPSVDNRYSIFIPWATRAYFPPGGFHSSLHISEETKNASIAVPWAVVSATLIGTVSRLQQ